MAFRMARWKNLQSELKCELAYNICLKKGRMPFLPFASKKVFLRECSDCKKWKAKKAGEEALC